MATAEKQQNPVKDEPQEDKKPNLKGPPQEDDYSDDYSDEYDDDYDYSDDDYNDDEEDDEPDTSGKAMQSYKGNHAISSRDQPPPQPPQDIQNGSISRADEKKSIDDQDGLKLKLDVNLDIEVELKARIHGDLTLALL